MISDSILDCIARNDEWALTRKEVMDMAKELLALRKAFSEPVVWAHVDELDKAVKVYGDGMMCGFGYVTKYWTAPNTILLYRKPQKSTT